MPNSKIKELLIKLVEIPSFVDSSNDEHKVIEFIADYVKENTSYDVILQKVEGKRSNLIIKGKVAPEVILFGHTDTVMPKAKNSLKTVEKDGNLYGLGTVDMKAGLAVMLKLLEKFDPESGLCLVFTVDEEYEFKGAKKLIEEYKFSPKYIINVEPTNLEILQGCRGIAEFSFDVFGKTAHAGRKHLGVNAIEKTMEIYAALETYLSKLNSKGDAKSTLNVGYLNGGTLSPDKKITCAPNIVPNFVETTGEIRIAHEEITEKLVKQTILEAATSLGVEIKNLKFKFYLGSMFTEKEDLKEFEDALVESDLPVAYSDVNQTGYFEVQIPFSIWSGTTVIFGPGPRGKAHSEDEYVELETVYKTHEVIENFLSKLLK